jgi:hypothetical protein
MAKKKLQGERLPPFVPIFNEELESAAYRAISPSAAKVYPFFKRINGKLKKKVGPDYNGIFDFTYSEAERYGFARKTFSRAITELNDKGFINIVSQGGKRGCGMSNSKYKLSDRWRDYGKTVKSFDAGKVVERDVFIKRPRYRSEPE